MATEDIYTKLGVGGYNPTYQAPEDIINRIASFQRNQRAAPFASEIQSAGQGYSQAAPDVQAQKRARANQLRQAFVAAGGRPDDLPRELWGSSPDQGFQIGDGQFHSYTPNIEDNMTYAQKTQRAGVTGLFEGKPTYDRQVKDADLTGMYKGKETPAYQLIKAQIDQKNDSGTSDMAEWIFKQNYQDQAAAVENAAKSKSAALESAYKYIEGMEPVIDKSTNTVIKPGWSTNTKAQMKQIVSAMLEGMIANGQSANDVAAKIRIKYPKTADDIISALYNAESQLQLGK